MLSKEGKFSALCFSTAVSVSFVLWASNLLNWEIISRLNLFIWLPLLCFSLLTGYILLRNTGLLCQVGSLSVFLGIVFSVGIFITLYSPGKCFLFGIYMCVMSFFHYSEFLAIAWCNPKTLSVSSFLLNHSTQYNIAAMASWTEFFLELYFAPGLKKYLGISCVGFLLCTIGEVLRKTAIWTGSTNFAHIVQTEKDENHELVTYGIYGICRHPSYVGWFYWAIGTQILLLNPFCTIAYTIISWKFFKVRIIYEEHTLLYFFGRDYMNYQKSVGTGLPGIKGYFIDEAKVK